MTITKDGTKSPSVAHWAALWGPKIMEARTTDHELNGNWLMLMYVMAENASTFHEVPEQPIQILIRETLSEALLKKNKRFAIPEGDEELFFCRHIANRLRILFPELCVVCEEQHLAFWIRSVTCDQLGAIASDTVSKEYYLSQAKSIPLFFADAFAESSPAALRDLGFRLGNLRRDLTPSRPPGRPRKQPAQQPASAGSRSLDPALSRRAYQLSLDGKDWHAIAKDLYPDLSPADRRTRKIEKRIGRLIDRGKINAKKSGRNK